MANRARIYVLADDLTGSADAANYFNVGVSRVRVTFPTSKPWDFDLGAEIIQVYDAESRIMQPEDALRKICLATQEIYGHYADALVYKKMDSTLRGNIGAEIEGALRGLERRVAIVAPSFPANHRTVVDGQLYVNHIPVDKTPFAQDPVHPIQDSRVGEQIRHTSGLLIRELTLQTIRTSSVTIGDFISNVIEEAESVGQRAVVIADAETEDDLTRIAKAVAWRRDVLPCGSAGLAKALASVWLSEHTPARASAKPMTTSAAQTSANRVMVLVGSANVTSHQQAQMLEESPAVDSIVIDSKALVDSTLRDDELDRVRTRIKGSEAPTVLIVMSTERVDPKLIQIPLVTDMAKTVGPILVEWLHHENARVAVVATGGDTALALCNELEVSSIWPEGELFPGVPWSTVEYERGKFALVSKAGGFGSSTVLQDAVRKLAAQ